MEYYFDVLAKSHSIKCLNFRETKDIIKALFPDIKEQVAQHFGNNVCTCSPNNQKMNEIRKKASKT